MARGFAVSARRSVRMGARSCPTSCWIGRRRPLIRLHAIVRHADARADGGKVPLHFLAPPFQRLHLLAQLLLRRLHRLGAQAFLQRGQLRAAARPASSAGSAACPASRAAPSSPPPAPARRVPPPAEPPSQMGKTTAQPARSRSGKSTHGSSFISKPARAALQVPPCPRAMKCHIDILKIRTAFEALQESF